MDDLVRSPRLAAGFGRAAGKTLKLGRLEEVKVVTRFP